MAAITLKQINPGFIDRYGVAEDFYDKTIDAVIEKWNETPLVNAQFFRTVTPRAGSYQETQFGTVLPLPVINTDSDRIPFVSPWRGFKKTFTTVEYRSGTRVERRASEEDLTGKIRRLVSGLMQSGRLLTEYQMADIFNNLTSTATAYVGADGVAIASASHPFERRQQGTWSNVQTSTAFTPANFSTARTSMRTRKNEFGDPIPINPMIVMIPPAIETAVRTVLASEKVAGGNLNDKNVWQGAVSIVVNPFLTSTTSWMLFGDMPKDQCGFLYIPEITPNISPVTGNDASTDIIWAERLRMIQAVGATIDRNIEYNAGS